MKKNRFILNIIFCIFIFTSIKVNAQTTVQIGTGNLSPSQTLYGPVYRYSATSATTAASSNMLFTAAELSAAGIISGDLITEIGFNKTNASYFNNGTGIPFTKRMGNTSNPGPLTGTIASEWSNILLTQTVVFTDNNFNVPQTAGWMTITLSSPLVYTGGSIELSTDHTMPGGRGATGNIAWEYTAGFDDYLIGAATSSNLSTYKQRPNTQITFVSGTPCSGTPNAGVASAPTLICASEQFNLSISGQTIASGINYQWLSSPNATGPWTPIVGATTMSATISQVSDTYYRCEVICTNSSLADTSTAAFVQTSANLAAGTYTVGVGGDYATFSAAVSSLSCGIAGPVIFDALVGSGPFNEQIIIPEVLNASAVNTVTINGNGETLTSTTLTGSRSLILLDGADYITIDSFNLVTQSAINNFVIQLTNDADYNTISNNTVDMSSTIANTGTTNTGILISGSLTSATAVTGLSGSNNSIIGNTIKGGYYGININGQSANRSQNNIIADNKVEDFYYYGISLRHNNDTEIINNEISRPTRTSVSSYYGIYLASGGEGNTISENYLHSAFEATTSVLTSAAYGIYHAANDSPINNPSEVFNNIIHLRGNESQGIAHNGTIYALYNSSSDGVHYYHNTVVLNDENSTSGITRGFYQLTTASDIEFKNNIINISRGGSGIKYTMYFGTAASSIESDYNVLSMNAPAGTNHIGYSGSAQTTLADWQTATSGDANSVDADPLLVSTPTINQIPTSPLVDNIGTPLAAVTTDFGGNLRDATTPDPGAHEFIPPSCPQPADLAVSNITGTAVDLEWIETGSATSWDIEWGQVGFTPTGTPTITATSDNPYNLTGLTILTDYDFYVRANCGAGSFSFWTGPFSFTTGCATQMAGTYTVGATGDFNTFTEAVNELNTCGISAPVVLNAIVGAGPFNEQLVIEEILNASATNTVTINGNGEILTSTTLTGSRSLILLDGADYITIDSFNLVTQSATNNFVIQLTNDADHNTIINNTVDMSSTIANTGSTNAGILISGSLTSATAVTGLSGSNNSIIGNTIKGGYYGIVISGQSGNPSQNNIIADNKVEDFYYYGIALRHNNDAEITNNEISRPTRTSVSAYYGIYLASGGEGNTISENYLHSAFGAITSVLTSAAYGIYHTANDSPINNPSEVFNNIIHLRGNESQGVAHNGIIYALYNSSSDGVHYYHNTVVLNDENSTTGTTRGFYQITTASDIEFKNNIINISRGGSGIKYTMYFATAASNIESDYNVLSMNAPAGTNHIGYSGSAQTTLADWQTATSGDANSVDADPLLVSTPAANQIPTNPLVNNIGTPLAAVTTDFGGNLRDATTPDPGAHEFIPPLCPQPAGIDAINITASTLDLEWIETGSATTWNIEYGLSGFTPGSGTPITTTNNPHSFTNLNPSSQYDFYVQSDCGGGDESYWSGPFSIYTACGVIVAPYYEAFNNGIEPQCWVNASSDPSTAVNNFWKFAGAPGSGAAANGKTAGTFAWSDGSSPYPDSMVLVTPEVDISQLTTPYLSFEWFSNNTTYPGMNVPLTIWIHDGASWNFLDTLQGDDPEWLFVNYDLNAYANSTIKVAFVTNQSLLTAIQSQNNDILLDEIRIDDCITLGGQDGTFDICRFDNTVNLNDNIIVKPNGGGNWSFPGQPQLITQDSIFQVTYLPAGSHEVYYTERFVCYDTTVATINVFGASSAGTGTVDTTVCMNSPIDLFASLTGNTDMDGVWYDFTNVLIVGSQPKAAAVPGDYNYTYITDNGVCPADTAIVMVTVTDTCDFLSIGEEMFTDISVYPNPATSELNIVNPSNAPALKVEMLDMNGRIVLVEEKALNNASETQLVIDHLEKGIYTLRIYNNDRQKVFKIVKQ